MFGLPGTGPVGGVSAVADLARTGVPVVPDGLSPLLAASGVGRAAPLVPLEAPATR